MCNLHTRRNMFTCVHNSFIVVCTCCTTYNMFTYVHDIYLVECSRCASYTHLCNMCTSCCNTCAQLATWQHVHLRSRHLSCVCTCCTTRCASCAHVQPTLTSTSGTDQRPPRTLALSLADKRSLSPRGNTNTASRLTIRKSQAMFVVWDDWRI